MTQRALTIDGDRLRETRERKGLNQPELAALCGITQPHLSNLENGRRNASPRLMLKLARKLRVSVDAITTAAEPEVIAS